MRRLACESVKHGAPPAMVLDRRRGGEMRRSVKTVLMLVLATLLVAGLSACGGDDATSTSNGSTSNGDSKKPSGTVTVWDPAYKAYPGYTKASDQLDTE